MHTQDTHEQSEWEAVPPDQKGWWPPVESLTLSLTDRGSGSGPRLVRLRTEGCQCEGGVEPGSYCPRLVGTTVLTGPPVITVQNTIDWELVEIPRAR